VATLTRRRVVLGLTFVMALVGAAVPLVRFRDRALLPRKHDQPVLVLQALSDDELVSCGADGRAIFWRLEATTVAVVRLG
jgi:hypothetical protein